VNEKGQQPNDYVMTAYATDIAGSDEYKLWKNHNSHRGALQGAFMTESSGVIQEWSSRGGFETILDGTSNTSMLAEKHISADGLGRVGDRHANRRDGPPFFLGEGNVNGANWGEMWTVGPTKNRPLARGPNHSINNINDGGKPNIGSWHPGGVQFLMCDASVHLLEIGIDQTLLQRIARREDGETITLPK
jgi:prepilin-type processing-associated H-X9-DG protein